MRNAGQSEIERLKQVIAAQSEIAAASLGLEDVMSLIVERARALTSANAGVIEIAEGEDMVYRAASGLAAAFIGLRLKIASSLSGACVRTGELLMCTDSETDPRVDRDACRRVSARSLLVVPLRHRHRTVGVLKVAAPEPSAFDAADAAILELMATVIAAALERAAAEAALRTSEERFRALADTAHDAIITIDAAGRVAFWNRTAESTFGRTSAEMLGERLDAIMPARSVAAHREGLRRVAAGGDARVVGRTVELSALRRTGDEFPIELSIGTWQSESERFYTAVLRDITQRKESEARLETLARFDVLTGLLTRGAGEERLANELARAERYGVELSFALLDVDHFKRVNDTHGHARGDLVLRTLGQLIARVLRTTDAAVRWGGEEILLILQHTPLEGARKCAERIRSELEGTDVDGLRVTLSAGVAQLEKGDTTAAAIARADARLYEAKAGGRNLVR